MEINYEALKNSCWNGRNYRQNKASWFDFHMPLFQLSGGCFTNVSRALQNILSKFVCCRNRGSCEHFKLKLCLCAQSHALGTCTKFQLEILTINVITAILYFREIILESSRNVSETTPWPSELCIVWQLHQYSPLINGGQNKMATILQKRFLNPFSWRTFFIKMFIKICFGVSKWH